MHLASYSKINYVLDVLSRRSDGYHEIASIFLPLALHDDLYIYASERITISCDDPRIPCDERNIAHKAALALKQHYHNASGCHIHIEKRIPLAGGLGGSATNGAATLRALNRLWGLGLSNQELAKIASQLGADVPFFLFNKPLLALGIGERLFAINAPILHIVVIEPAITYFEGRHKTRELYTQLDAVHYEHLDTNGALNALKSADLGSIASFAGNVFEAVAFKAAPQLQRLREALLENGALYAGLCGSGPCLWALAKSAGHAIKIADAIASLESVRRAIATHTLA